jgi:O-antigen/teichoic acid export membrane protein
MGIIRQQTIKSSIYSYLGVLIGFLSVNILQPHSLTTAQVGLLGILGPFSLMFAQFAILGFNGTARYFPYFRSEEKKHHGYLFLGIAISLIGMLIYVVLAWLLKNDIVSQKAHKSTLFTDYYWFLVPLTFFTLFFNLFNLYARMLYNTTSGTILNEFGKRLFILIPIVLIYFGLINFASFMWMWLLANIIPTLLIINRVRRDDQLFLQPDFGFLDKDIRRKMISISLFSILTGSAPLIIQNVDSFFINQKFGLSELGVYTIAFYFGTIITIPTRSLYNIAFTFVTEAWKTNDLEKIRELYEKSCITQLLSALFLFILIWANVGNIFHILPPAYAAGKYVILFVGIGYIIDSAAGINNIILGTSKYYPYDMLFYIFLIGITILSNMILIPIYGITGAAMAYAITLFGFNLFRYIFILTAFKMQPFNYRSLVGIAAGLAVYYAAIYLPQMNNFIVDTIMRSIFITLTFGVAVYYFNLSVDINQFLDKYLVKFKIKK